jgi:hypothetical protein
MALVGCTSIEQCCTVGHFDAAYRMNGLLTFSTDNKSGYLIHFIYQSEGVFTFIITKSMHVISKESFQPLERIETVIQTK